MGMRGESETEVFFWGERLLQFQLKLGLRKIPKPAWQRQRWQTVQRKVKPTFFITTKQRFTKTIFEPLAARHTRGTSLGCAVISVAAATLEGQAAAAGGGGSAVQKRGGIGE
jgi:hypothetical protein